MSEDMKALADYIAADMRRVFADHAAKLDALLRQQATLIAALAADEEEEPELTDLEGHGFGGERDSSQSLD